MIKNLVLLIALAIALLVASCSVSSSRTALTNQPNNTTNAASPKPAEETAKNTTKDNTKDNKETTTKKPEASGDKSACLTAKMEGKRLIADQTFVFDYEPFPKSCFVTFASKEDMLDEKDVPRGSTFHIFKDGKNVYDFEDAFDGMPACWVEGVGFEDLNGNGTTEVIIAGSCLSAKNSYPMNAIYENFQDDFRTYRVQNEALDSFTTVKQISDYAKKNNDKFFNRR